MYIFISQHLQREHISKINLLHINLESVSLSLCYNFIVMLKVVYHWSFLISTYSIYNRFSRRSYLLQFQHMYTFEKKFQYDQMYCFVGYTARWQNCICTFTTNCTCVNCLNVWLGAFCETDKSDLAVVFQILFFSSTDTLAMWQQEGARKNSSCTQS